MRPSTADRDAAMDWMDANQLGRRNLAPDQRSLLRGRMYNREKKRAGGRADRDLSGAQSEHPKTAEKIAERTKVSPATVRRDGKRAEAIATAPDDRIIGDGRRQARRVSQRVDNQPFFPGSGNKSLRLQARRRTERVGEGFRDRGVRGIVAGGWPGGAGGWPGGCGVGCWGCWQCRQDVDYEQDAGRSGAMAGLNRKMMLSRTVALPCLCVASGLRSMMPSPPCDVTASKRRRA